MAIRTEELIDITTGAPSVEIDETEKLSDWVEAQPVERFMPFLFRDMQTGKMCGIGMVADYYGFDWDAYNPAPVPAFKMRTFLHDRLGLKPLIREFIFDKIYMEEGPEAAKAYTVNALREAGL